MESNDTKTAVEILCY